MSGTHEFRKVTLRDERAGKDSRHLWAYVDEAGNLHIDGQDLGPGTAPVSPDGEYEWFKTIAAVDVPRLVSLLGGTQGEDVLHLLERSFSGAGSYELRLGSGRAISPLSSSAAEQPKSAEGDRASSHAAALISGAPGVPKPCGPHQSIALWRDYRIAGR